MERTRLVRRRPAWRSPVRLSPRWSRPLKWLPPEHPNGSQLDQSGPQPPTGQIQLSKSAWLPSATSTTYSAFVSYKTGQSDLYNTAVCFELCAIYMENPWNVFSNVMAFQMSVPLASASPLFVDSPGVRWICSYDFVHFDYCRLMFWTQEARLSAGATRDLRRYANKTILWTFRCKCC